MIVFSRLSLVSALVALAVALGASPRAAAEAAFVGMQVQGITPAVAAALGLEDEGGVLVRDVALGGPSAEAGFRRGDLIVRFAGRDVDTFEALVAVVKGLKAGQGVTATVLRRGAKVELTMKTGVWPPSWRISAGAFATIPAVGLTLAALTKKTRDVFSLRWGSTGVAITLVDAEKSADMDLRRGELILQVDQEAVWMPDQVVARYREAKKKGRQKLSCLSMKLSKAAETQRMSHRGFQSLCHIRVRTVQLPPTSL